MKLCTDDDVRVGVTGHGGLLRAFSFARPITGSGHTSDLSPDMPGDLGFAVQFNAETPCHFAQLRYPRFG